jgi:hypothetical protein
MAKVLFGDATLSGKLGSRVYAYNRAGFYVRQFRKPVDPATNAQLNNRGYFTNAVTAWHSLSDVQKGLWNAYATTNFHAKFPKSGVAYNGFNAFISMRNAIINAQVKGADPSIILPGTASNTPGLYLTSMIPPHTGFSAAIFSTDTGTLPVTISAVDVVLTGGAIGVTFDFGHVVGTGVTPNPPEFVDAIGAVPVGYVVTGSLPLTQEQQFVENPDINILAILNPIGPITGWTAARFMTVLSNYVPEFYSRKNTYAAGDLIQVKVYALGQNGATQFVGSVFTTVTI